MAVKPANVYRTTQNKKKLKKTKNEITVITVKDDKEFKVCMWAAARVYGAKAKRFMLLCITEG